MPDRSAPERSSLLTAALAAAAFALLLPVAALAGREALAQASTAASCSGSCRGLGLEKVKAGDEHCGFISRERKETALAAACGLAESNHEALSQTAEERAWAKCDDSRDESACSCTTELRSWQNIYTHVLSQRCWAECGWAYVIECERRSESDDGDEPASR